MSERMTSARPGGPWAMPLGLVAGFLTLVLAACGGGNSPTTPAVAGECHVTCSDASPSAYVAIAVSPTSFACGSATAAASAEEAEKLATAKCGGGDCAPVIWGHKGVAAVAVNQVAYGWGWAPDAASTAEAKAMASCVSRTP